VFGQKVYFKLNWQHIEYTRFENILLSLHLLSSTNKLRINKVDKSFDQNTKYVAYKVYVCRVMFMIIIKKKKHP